MDKNLEVELRESLKECYESQIMFSEKRNQLLRDSVNSITDLGLVKEQYIRIDQIDICLGIEKEISKVTVQLLHPKMGGSQRAILESKLQGLGDELEIQSRGYEA